MILRLEDGVHDYDLGLLKDVLSPIDAGLASVIEDAAAVEDPDSFGCFERGEHVTGLGFVACQAYLTATFSTLRISKAEALDAGPVHACGRTVVSIVNHAANHWKHDAESVLDPNDARRRRIVEAFEDLGFPINSSYPLSCILANLVSPQPPRFESLVPSLIAWRDVLLNRSSYP